MIDSFIWPVRDEQIAGYVLNDNVVYVYNEQCLRMVPSSRIKMSKDI